MEVINIFNKELKSILESKLPVSRHKMSLITKSAMKALKFYKHVVQSVEKFINKCSCDYKVPGLYVIDAIVRQSKHQYCEKDVFVPRFMRNIVTTFIHLAQCDPKDVTSIERVLRLWQQNGVFPTDLVEALLELVYDANDKEKIMKAGEIVLRLVNEWNILKGKPEEKMELFIPHNESVPINISINEVKNEGGLIDSITKLLTRFQAETGQDVTLEINQIQILHQKIVEQSALLAQGEMIDSDTLSQLHQSMEELTKKAAKAAAVQQSKLAMLANDDKDHMNEASTDLEFVEQLQQMVDTLGQTRALQEELRQALESKQNTTIESEELAEDKDFRELEEGEESFTIDLNDSVVIDSSDMDLRMMHNNSPKIKIENNESEHESVHNMSYDKISRSPSNTSRKRRRSNSENGFSKRKRSESKDHKRREKRKRYLPILRDQRVGILSHTLFIGHLHKHVSESKLRIMCEEFGSISEFNMIPPRGCAFVTFDKRKSAYKAISKMHELKFEGRDLKVAWAPNKGVKDEKEFRDYWVVEEGCTYIPMEQFPINRSSELIDGSAELDEDSLTLELKQAIYQFEQQKSEAVARGLEPSSVETMISVAAEVANKNIPLLSPNGEIEPGSIPFFNQFNTPPPMMLPPPVIPFPPPPPPPPPHMFMGVRPMPPPLQLSGPTSCSNNVNQYNHVSASTPANSGMESGTVSINSNIGTIRSMTPGYPQRPIMADNHRVLHRHPLPGFIRPSPFRRPLMRSSLARGGRLIRGLPMRFPRLPPPGFPAYRTNMINARPPRF